MRLPSASAAKRSRSAVVVREPIVVVGSSAGSTVVVGGARLGRRGSPRRSSAGAPDITAPVGGALGRAAAWRRRSQATERSAAEREEGEVAGHHVSIEAGWAATAHVSRRSESCDTLAGADADGGSVRWARSSSRISTNRSISVGPSARPVRLHLLYALTIEEQDEGDDDEADDGADHQADQDPGVADVEADLPKSPRRRWPR